MRRLLLVLVAGCAQAPVFEADVLTATPCTTELKQPGDEVEVVEVSAGVLEARLVRNGSVVAWGRAKRVEGVATTVIVRKVSAFTPVCVGLNEGRAGHAAVLLAEGAIHLSGGYRTDGSGRVALVTTELYSAGRFSGSTSLTLAGSTPLPKAFHTATRLENGQVLLASGERYAGSTSPVSQAVVLVFDATAGAIGAVPSRFQPPNIPRTRHLAVSTDAGVLIAGGGRTSMASPQLMEVLELEHFDSATNTVRIGPTMPAAVTAGAWVPGVSEAVLVSGAMLTRVDAALSLAPQAASLSVARSTAHAFGNGGELIVAGEGTSEIVQVAAGTVAAGPALPTAAGSCAAALGGERWLFVSGSSAALLSKAAGGYTAAAVADLPLARTEATCTALDDGTVLVAGGLGASGAVLADAWVFTPPLE